MSDLQNILKEEYIKQVNELDLKMLLEMVEEVYDFSGAPVEEEVAPPTVVPTDDKAALEMILKMIPEIEVSEIGWSDVRTPENEKEVKGPQRQLLEGYLKNIKGADFAERVASVSKFYSDGTGMIETQAGQVRTQRIVQAISYLVFYKTLTKVITNFNASSAGFSFESFLAALVNGYQIKANSGTIADYIDRASGQEIPVSLKLYREGSLEVGGSYTDLVNDLAEPKYPGSIGGGMRYVVCTKTLSGTDLDQEGQIDFYQFDFNLDNVFDILVNSKEKSQKCIMLPQGVVGALSAGQQSNIDISDRLPSATKLSSPEQLEKDFIVALKDLVIQNNIPIDDDNFNQLTQALNWAKNDKLFKDADPARFGGVPQGVVRGISKTQPEVREQLVNKLFPQMPWRAAGRGGREKLITIIGAANAKVVNSQSATKKADERTQEISRMVKEGEFLSPEESARQYKMLGREQKKIALRNSWGYLTTGHFSLNQTQATNSGEPTNTIEIGSIMVGRRMVAIAVEGIRDILNEEVAEIFQSLKILSDSLNQFFAGGLENDGLANTATQNANNISSKEILKTDK